jgi:hypothetical protein
MTPLMEESVLILLKRVEAYYKVSCCWWTLEWDWREVHGKEGDWGWE